MRYAQGKCASCAASYNLQNGRCQPAANFTNFVSEACQVCAPNYYISKVFKCTPFEVGCTSYVGGQCTNCASPFEISSDGACFIDGCETADSTGCLKCQSVYQPDGKVCRLPNCEQAKRGVCLRCAKGYVVKSGFCSKMDPNCQQYTKEGVCASCIDGFHLDSQGKCKENALGCIYTGSDCTSCKSPFTLANGECTIVGCEEYTPEGCKRCSNSLYLAGGICKQRKPGCQYDIAGKCTGCSSKFTYQDGQCTIEGCSQYSLDACTSCDQPYKLVGGSCSIPNCVEVTGGKCSKCSAGYQTVASGACTRFIDNCADYDGDYCQTCKGGFYLAATKNQCLPTTPGCIYREGACAACLEGYLLDGGLCYKIDPNCIAQAKDRRCTACRDTFYIDTAGICQQGDPQCEEFTTAGDGKCKRCRNNYYVNELGGCSQKLPGCEYKNGKWASCRAPFTTKESGICQIVGCLNYSSEGCVSCAPAYTLTDFLCRAKTDGSCLEYDAVGLCTKCERGYTLLDGHCEVRDEKCKKLSAEGKCLECVAGYFLTNLGTC